MAKILVVDDHSTSQRLLRFILQQSNHTVLSAFNGFEALECLSRTDVDLLLTDLLMPEMDGLTLLEQLRSDERYKALPIIILTASEKEQHHQRAKAAGVTAVLTKPIESNEIIETVNRSMPHEQSVGGFAQAVPCTVTQGN